jgi:hypothetical protein
MKHTLIFLTISVITKLVAYCDDSLLDCVQVEKGGVGISTSKVSVLQSIALNRDSSNYYAANALLAGYHIDFDKNDGQFTNAHKYAVEAFRSPKGRWEKIYAGLTLVTIEGTGYRHNYTNQIVAILQVLDEIKNSNWESPANPIYSLLKQNGIVFGRAEISDFMKSQLVSAYCNIGQIGSAECVIQGISNVEVSIRAKGRVEFERQTRDKREKQGKGIAP